MYPGGVGGLRAADHGCLLVADTVSSKPRQEADFRCACQGWPRSAVGEVRKLALPAMSCLRRVPAAELAYPVSVGAVLGGIGAQTG